MTAADELAEALAGPEPDFDAEPAPVDLEQAERFMRHLALLDQADAYDTHAADTEKERVEEWLADRLDVRAKKRRFYDAVLQQTMRAHVEAGGPKTLKLPSGELRARAQQPEWEFTDETLAYALAHDFDAWFTTTYRVDRAQLKKVLHPCDGDGTVGAVDPESGEVIPGVSVTFRPDRYQAVPADPRVKTEVEPGA